MNTTCPHCDHIFQGRSCPTCGYTAQAAARERRYHRAPCDFCDAPWEAQWVDFMAGGVRFVCRTHSDPITWLPGVRPRYVYDHANLEGTANEPGVQVHRGGVRAESPAPPAPTMAAQVAEKLAMKEL